MVKRDRDQLEREQEREDLGRVMDTKWGRRFIWRQLEKAGVFRSSFAGEATHATSFNEGQRNAGLKLFADLIEWCPGLYAKMQAENVERE